MSKRSSLLIGVMVLAGAASAAAVMAQVQSPPLVPAAPMRPFRDSAVFVGAKPQTFATLEQVEIRSLGGRTFIVGREAEGYDLTKNRFPGATVWVPVDDVMQIVELPPKKNSEQKAAK